MSKRAQRVAMWCAGCFALLAALLITWDFAEPRVARCFPLLAWRYGTPEMQRYAAQVLITRIKPGMSYNDVLQMVGPGSDGWPSLKSRTLAREETVGFNIRAPRNNGMDVGFKDGRVVSTFYYD